MTAQARERLFYKGEETWMATEPLFHYLQNRNDINFIWPSTACWRGYYGQWEIKKNKLFLIGLKGYIEGYKEVSLDYIFPGQDEVFAKWFSGEIRIEQGEMLEYIHMGYGSVYEKDLILNFDNGILLEEKLIDNREEFNKRKTERDLQKEITDKSQKKTSFWRKLFGR